MNNRYLVFMGVILFFPLCLFMAFMVNKKLTEAKVDCIANYKMVLPNKKDFLVGSLSVILWKNTSSIVVKADYYEESLKKYHVYRDVKYNYSKKPSGVYDFNTPIITKSKNDTMPDELFNTVILDMTMSNKIIRISSLQNAFVFWNAFNPMFLCIKNE